MIRIESKGSTAKVEAYIKRVQNGSVFQRLEKFAKEGVDALKAATPVDSGISADSWTYEITKRRGRYTITWYNTNANDGVPIVILIQYGHATGTGGWVEGRDFINPVILPLFDRIADDVWKEVTKNG